MILPSRTLSTLQRLPVYQESMALASTVYNIVAQWSWFDKDTLGKQLVRAIDSVGANVTEGYGRFYFKDKSIFFIYARASAFESIYHIELAIQRKLITEGQKTQFCMNLNKIIFGINILLQNTRHNTR